MTTENREAAVTDADIARALPFLDGYTPGNLFSDQTMARRRKLDHHPLIQAFAQHRSSELGGAEAVRLMRAYYAAEDARNDCSECENEGQWEHCGPCSERIGEAINDQLLFLASQELVNDDDTDAARLDYARAMFTSIVANPEIAVALAKAGLDFCNLTSAERAQMRGGSDG